ncbi:MAG: YIP1 family protein [Fidelibacterota bacterium]|nr:MAG: YIP1 family protein [Candidatus Neomarinimicrobiota bacterium]
MHIKTSLPVERLWGVIITPKATFQSLAQSIGTWDLVAPLLILLALSMASQALVGPIRIEEQRQIVLQREDIPEDQKEIYLERLDGALARPSRYLIGGGTVIIWYAMIGGIVMFFGAFILGGQASYRDTLVVVLYANLVAIVEMALKIPLILQLGTTKVKTGLVLLLPGSLEGALLYRFFQRLDFFAMWKIFLVAMGTALIYTVEEKRARTVLFGAWLLVMFLLAWLLDGRGIA